VLLYKVGGKGVLDWFDILSDEIEGINLPERLRAEKKAGRKVYPSTMAERIFRCFNNTPWDETLVVIVGKEPYPKREHASGLAFGVPKTAEHLPVELENMSRELKEDAGSVLKDVTLEQWAEQGVLLLNTHLTVGETKGSHKNWGWESVSGAALKYLNYMDWPIVFMLWGSQPQELGDRYITNELHIKIKSPGPDTGRFLGSKPFSRCNEFLATQGLTIDW
jgi:uracil-DNA glycosylase